MIAGLPKQSVPFRSTWSSLKVVQMFRVPLADQTVEFSEDYTTAQRLIDESIENALARQSDRETSDEP